MPLFGGKKKEEPKKDDKSARGGKGPDEKDRSRSGTATNPTEELLKEVRRIDSSISIKKDALKREPSEDKPKKPRKPTFNISKDAISNSKVTARKRMSLKRDLSEVEKKKMTSFHVLRKQEATERDDGKRLSTFTVTPPKEIFAAKQNFNWSNFTFVYNLASRLGSVTAPEIVIVGLQGTGKSELLEALIGHPLNAVGYKEAGKTKRPLYVQLINNDACAAPKLTFELQNKSEQTNLNAVSNLIQSHAEANFAAEPMYLQYEYKNCFNVGIIDTPGLPFDLSADEFAVIELYLEEILRPNHRLIVCVEDADQLSNDVSRATEELRKLIARIDPYKQRTVFVYNKFNTLIDRFTNPSELTDYLQASSENGAFWLTLLSQLERDKVASNAAQFVEKLEQANARDKKQANLLLIESKFVPRLGSTALREHGY